MFRARATLAFAASLSAAFGVGLVLAPEAEAQQVPTRLTYPIDGASLANPSFVFTWTGTTAATYTLEVASNASFANVVLSRPGLTARRYQLLPSEALTRGSTYWWRITTRPIPNPGAGTTTLPLSFTVAAKPLRYRLEVASDRSFAPRTLALVKPGLTGTSYSVAAAEQLQTGLTYYWRVRARGPANTDGPYGEVRSLRIAPDTSAPAMPDLLYPRDGDAVAAAQPSFDWSDVADPNGAVLYRLQVARDAAFNNLVVDRTGLTASTHALAAVEALGRGASYFWRVGVRDTNGNEAFTQAFALSVQARPIRYLLEVSSNATFTRPPVYVPGIAATQYAIPAGAPLLTGQTYWWRVSAFGPANVQGPYSAVRTLRLAPDTSAPAAVDLLYPRDGDAMATASPSFDWTDAVDPNGAVTYRLQIAGNAAFTSPVVDQAAITASTYALTAAQGLARGQTWFWRVAARDAAGNEAFGQPFSFAVQQRPARYELQIARDAAFTQVHADESVGGTSYTLAAQESLLSGQQYWWRVRARGPANVDGPFSAPFQLRIATDTSAPPSVALLYPNEGDVVVNPRTSFDWSDAFDASGPVTYRLQIAATTAFSPALVDQTGLNASTYALTAAQALPRNASYFWRVAARDAAGNEAFTAPRPFTILSRPTTYAFEIARDAAFTDVHHAEPGLTARQLTLSAADGLQGAVTYYWRVKARGPSQVEGPYSATFTLRLATDNTAPAAVALLYPRDADTVVNPRPPFDWSDASDAASYRIQVSSSAAFTTTLIDQSGVTTSRYTPAAAQALARNATYFWRVAARDAAGNEAFGPAFSFSVATRPTTYELDVARDAAFTAVEATRVGVAATTVTLAASEALRSGETYYWRVRARGPAQSEGPFSTTFTLRIAPDTSAPPAAALLYPRDGDTVLAPRVSFDWTDAPGATAYRVQVTTAADTGFGSPLVDRTLAASAYQLTGAEALARGASYLWRVASRDAGGNEAFGAAFTFSVGARPVRYRLEVARDADFLRVHTVQAALAGTSYALAAQEQLSSGITYYWRVSALGPTRVASPYSAVRTLRIAADTDAPLAVQLLYPRDRDTVINPRVPFDWTDASDPSGGVTYTLQVAAAADTSFASPLVNATGLADSTFVPAAGALARNATYLWRVGTADGAGNTAFGAPFTFTLRSLVAGELEVPSTGALTYRLEVSTVATFATTVVVQAAVAGTSYRLAAGEALATGGTYFWRVRASRGGVNSPYSSIWRLTTNPGGTTPLPALLYPIEQAALASPRPSFDWTDSGNTLLASYRLQVATEVTFGAGTVLIDRAGLTASAYLPAANEALARGAGYFWRVGTTLTDGTTTFGEVRPFSVITRPISYRLEVAEAPSFATPAVVRNGVAGTTIALTAAESLKGGTTYYWRVAARGPANRQGAFSAPFAFTTGADDSAPDAVALLYPRDGEAVINPRTSFTWSASGDASGYRLQVARASSFAAGTIVVDRQGLTATTYALAAGEILARDQAYFWRVGAIDATGNLGFSAPFGFSVQAKPMRYEVQISRTSTFDVLERSRSGIAATQVTLTAQEQVESGVSYFWRARARGPANTDGAFSTPFRFQIAPDTTGPAPVALAYPLDGDAVLNPRTSFDWEAAVDPGAVTYRLQVAANSAFTTPLVDQANIAQTTYALSAAQALPRGAGYFWRVGARDAAGNETFTLPFTFSVQAKPTRYELQISRTSTFDTVERTRMGIAATQVTLAAGEALDSGISYFWRVRARGPANADGAFSNAFRLQIAPDTTAPRAVALLYPPDGDALLNPRASLDWNGTIESGATYRVQVAADAAFTTPLVDVANLAASAYQLTAAQSLPRNAGYFWRVGVRDGAGNEAFGAPFRFSVQAKPIVHNLQLSRTNDFRAVERNREGIAATQLALTAGEALESGVDWYWRVSARGPAGTDGAFSAPFRLRVAPDTSAPAATALLYPIDGDSVLNPRVSFDWNGTIEAGGSYRVQVASNAAFTTPLVDVSGVSASAYQLTAAQALPRNASYFWRVGTRDAAGNESFGAPFRFTVLPKGVRYNLEVSSSPVFTNRVVSEAGLPTARYTLAARQALQTGVTYYWRVSSRSPANTDGPFSQVFTLRLSPDTDAPPAVGLLYPKDGDAIVSPRASLDWTDAVDPAGTARYRVQVARDAAFLDLILDRAGLARSSYTLEEDEALPRNATYFWRVGTADALGNESFGLGQSFNVLAKRIRYRVEIGLDPQFARRHVNVESLTAPTYRPAAQDALRTGVQYYWHVQARGPAGTDGVFSQTYALRVGTDVDAPPFAELLYPQNGVNQANPRPSLDWADVTDPNGVTYRVQVANDAAFTDVVIDRDGLTRSNYVPAITETLARNRTYFWRVGVRDGLGNAAFGPAWRFTVLGTPAVASYTLQIGNNPTFSSQHLTRTGIVNARYTLAMAEQLPVAVTYWRVRTIDNNNNPSPWSEAWTLYPPEGLTTRTVVAQPQPERLDYNFGFAAASTWALELRRWDGSRCTELLHSSTAPLSTSVSGTWSGLSPGASYCWIAIPTDGRGPHPATGTVAFARHPTFTGGPAVTLTSIAPGSPTYNAVATATTSAPGTGTIQLSAAACNTIPTALSFDGTRYATVPGKPLPLDAFSIEVWVNPASAAANGDLFNGPGGNVRLSMNAGRPRISVRTATRTASIDANGALAATTWSYVAATYDGNRLSLVVNGAPAQLTTLRGNVVDATAPGAAIGMGFTGAIASIALEGRAITDQEIADQRTAGVGAELGSRAGAIAAWRFDEGSAVQSIYDSTGNGHSGVLGASHLVEAIDATRLPGFGASQAMGTNVSSLRTTLTGLPTSTTYCWRVSSATARGVITSSPLGSFTTPEPDRTPPTVTVAPTFSVDCAGNGGAQATPPSPVVVDDLDPAPVVEAHRGPINGPVITFPARFDVGATNVTWAARDRSGNIGTGVTRVTVRDAVAPVIVGGAEVRLEATSPNGTVFAAAPESTSDACSAPQLPGVTSDAPIGGFPLGTTVVTFTATDIAGNTATATRAVTVRDTSPPVFDPPLASLTISHDGSACFAYQLARPGVRDNGTLAGDITVTGRRVSGPGAPTCWNVGTHVVEWTATDASGNTVTGTQTIQVNVASPLQATVTARGQPERLDYDFRYTQNASWTVELRRWNGNACGELLYQRTAANTTRVNGTWSGLSPGGAYCWSATPTDMNGPRTTTGTVGFAALPRFTAGPSARRESPTSLSYVVSATASAFGRGTVQYRAADCDTIPTSLDLNGAGSVSVPGNPIPASAFSIETWIQPTSANQGADVFTGPGGAVALALNQGRPRFSVSTAAQTGVVESPVALAANAWAFIAATYDGAEVRLYVDGVARGSVALTGTVRTAPPGMTIGGTGAGGLVGRMASMALFSRALSSAEVTSQLQLGAGTELGGHANAVAVWRFDEAPGVQSIYDATGNHHSGVIGASWLAEASDAGRFPTFPSSAAAGNGTSLLGRLPNLASSTSYCYRVISLTGTATIATTPLASFSTPVDRAPVVTVDPLFVAECTGNSGAAVTPPSPQVSDDQDPSPAVAAHLGLATDMVVTFPRRFSVGTTLITWTATDFSGNVGQAPVSVRVRDLVPPEVTGGAPVTIEASSPAGTPFAAAPERAFDACTAPAAPSISSDAPGGFPLGTTVVTFTVRDPGGNVATATRQVTVVDTTGPVFDPPLGTINVGNDRSQCFVFQPPRPQVRDNSTPSGQILMTWRRTGGPGTPQCWDNGSHTVEWTATDRNGNVTVGTQTVVVRDPTIFITPPSPPLEVGGLRVVSGTYYNQQVVLLFDLRGGTPPYNLTLVPPPDTLTNNGNSFRAIYNAPGGYGRIFVSATDSTGEGLGSATLDGFGIDRTLPVVPPPRVPGLDQTGVVLGNADTYPILALGEKLPVGHFRARDCDEAPVPLRRAVRLNRRKIVWVEDFEAGPSGPVTFAGWIRPRVRREATIVAQEGGFGLGLGPTGRPRFRLNVNNREVSVEGGDASPGSWHYIVGTYNGRVLQLYVDGEPAGYAAAGGRVTLPPRRPVTIGAEEDMEADCDGDLAQVVIEDVSYDDEIIYKHFSGGKGEAIMPTPNTLMVQNFEGDDQELPDASQYGNDATLGPTNQVEDEDPEVFDIEQPEDPTASGLTGLQVTLSTANGSRSQTLVMTTTMASGSPLMNGARALGGEGCTAPSMLCTAQDPTVDTTALRAWDNNSLGAYHMTVTATDLAGNMSSQTVAFRSMDYVRALEFAMAQIDRITRTDPFAIAATNELAAARLDYEAAHAYATMSPRYMDGSYLRADFGNEGMEDAAALNVDIGKVTEYVARTLNEDADLYTRGLTVDAPDRALREQSLAYYEDAKFEAAQARWGQTIALARTGYDAAALLHPQYRPMRQRLAAARATWNGVLGRYSRGEIPLEQVRIDSNRVQGVQQLISSTRDMLRDSLFPEITAALASRYTTQRTALTAILNTIDKTSDSVPGEAGDLVAITNMAVTTACLDRLARLDLDDRTFTQCYLRLNDLARQLDGVSEPLVWTYRWRAGVGLALFNMLELSLYISPTGLPWITGNTPSPALELVLPDALAATIPGTTPVSTVDAVDGALTRAYERHASARTDLEEGDVNAAFATFVQERCLLARLYNRYYSTNRSVPNVSDPKEPPLDPAQYGCPP